MSVEAGARPLGVLPTVTLTEKQLRGFQALQDFDLSVIRQRLKRDAVMPEAWLDDALLEFRRYLGLRLMMSGPLIMFSDHIDHVWHTCILFTQLYADLCQQAFGEFVHHQPTMHDDPTRDAQIAALQARYREVYGEMSHLWGDGHGHGCS